MAYTFLKETVESVLLFATAPVYLTIVGILQSKNLDLIGKIKRKRVTDAEKSALQGRLRRLKRLTPVLISIGAFVHIVAYTIFATPAIRPGYFMSIGIMYGIYLSIAWINFYLKGAGVLKDIGDFNGLPGN